MNAPTSIAIHGKTLEIRLTDRARQALTRRDRPLLAEMELLFSCMIRKRVFFMDHAGEPATEAAENLRVRFRPVMTKVCSMAEVEGKPTHEDFPIANPKPYVPHWLAIDHRNGEWQGEFGYLGEN